MSIHPVLIKGQVANGSRYRLVGEIAQHPGARPGRDNATLPEPTSSHINCLKTRRLPPRQSWRSPRGQVGPQRPSCSRIAMSCVQQPEQLKGLEDRTPPSGSSAGTGTVSLYREEKQMTTSSYVGIDVSKDKLDIARLGEKQTWQVSNTNDGIEQLVKEMLDLQPELIVVEATGGYQRAVVEALFHGGLTLAVVNPARVRQFARAS